MAAPGAAAAGVLRVDVDGDSFPDAVVVERGHLVVVSGTTVASVRLHANGAPPRLDGAIRLRGLAGALILVRVASGHAGVTDAVYGYRLGTLQRLHVHDGRSDGMVTALGGAGFVDFDCGSAPRTLDQISAEPRGSVWHETVSTFALQPQGFVLASVNRRVVSGTQASRRRCPLLRVP